MSKVVEGQTDIFSMFGLVDEVAEQKKREEEERKKKLEELQKKAASSSKAKTEKKAADEFSVDENTVIRYFGENIEIQQYFSAEEIAEGVLVKKKGEEKREKITGEMLRKRMERDFPELVKGMTEMVYVKDKNLVVPVMQAKKKGNCILETSSAEGVSSFLSPVRIPFFILRDFIAVAKLFAEESLEVHADIYMNRKGQFLLDFPEQIVHRFYCEVAENPYSLAMRIPDGYKKVAEIHSHHHMSPLPSIQDNRSEIVPGMIYIIVGYTQKVFPELFIRKYISPAHGWKRLSYHDVFEDPFRHLPELDMSRFHLGGNADE